MTVYSSSQTVDASVLQVEDSLIRLDKDNTGYLVIANPTGFTQSLAGNTRVGGASPVTVEERTETKGGCDVCRVSVGGLQEDRDRVQWRKRKLESLLEEPHLPSQEKMQFLTFLADHHHMFSLEEGERGETGLVQMEIDTGDARPKKQQVGRMPPAVRQEVTRQLEKMQREGVIEPSNSPWASPVVLVRKRD